MTDAVKQAIERLSTIRSCTDAKLVWLFEDGTPLRELAASFYDDLAILIAYQAEIDKLAAEVERLSTLDPQNFHDAGSALNLVRPSDPFYDLAQKARRAMTSVAVRASNAEKRAEAAEAKLTALVEALGDAKTLFNQIALERRKLGPLATQAQQMAHRLAALAHHSAPVGEAGKTVLNAEASEVFVTALAEPPEPNAALWKAAAQHHLRALLFAARTSGGASGPDDYLMGVCARAEAFMVSAPPSTPTSAPVEDVGGLRAEVLAFARLMEAQLRANDYKPGWKDENPWTLLDRLFEEAREVSDELQPGSRTDVEAWRNRIGAEAADVANFALMIADVCGSLAALPPALIQPQGEERS